MAEPPNLDPTLPTETREPPGSRATLNVFIGTAIMVVGLIYGALGVAGVTNMSAAHLMLVVAWIAAITGVCLAESFAHKPLRQVIKLASITAIVAGIALYGTDRWMVNEKAEQESKIPVSNANSELQPTATPAPSERVVQESESKETSNPREKLVNDKEKRNDTRQQTLNIWSDQTGSAFAGDVRIGVNGINFEGNPLHHTVNATINSPGHKALVIHHQEINDPVVYSARTVYEITVLKADATSATFQVTKVQEQDQTQTSTASKRRSKSQGARHKAAMDALLGKH